MKATNVFPENADSKKMIIPNVTIQNVIYEQIVGKIDFRNSDEELPRTVEI
jgi:hypothetical protein